MLAAAASTELQCNTLVVLAGKVLDSQQLLWSACEHSRCLVTPRCDTACDTTYCEPMCTQLHNTSAADARHRAHHFYGLCTSHALKKSCNQ
eukprot:13502-Heterococcus_DN1.PRE.5